MKKAQVGFAFLVAACCSAYLFAAAKTIEIGTLLEPGPGFMPAMIGVVGLVCALIIMIGAIRKPPAASSEEVDRAGRMRFLMCLAVSVVFVPVFSQLGAVLAIFLLVLLLTKVLGETGWLKPLIVAGVSAATTYVLFVRMLDVPLPKGIL